MEVTMTGRVIDMFKGDDPKWPNTSVTVLEPETRSNVLVKLVPADAGKVSLDGFYKFEGVLVVQKAAKAFGASYLTFKEGVKVTAVKPTAGAS